MAGRRGAYRDHDAAVEAQIAALEARRAELEGQLPPTLRRHLPAELQQRLASAIIDDDRFRRAEALTERVAELEQVVEDLPALRQRLLAMPGDDDERWPAPHYAAGPKYAPKVIQALTALRNLLARWDPAAAVWAKPIAASDAALEAFVRPEQTPIAITLHWAHDYEAAEGPSHIVYGEAWTVLPAVTPRLSVFREHFTQRRLLKPLRLLHDVQVGDALLDQRWVFRGDKVAVRVLLTPRARRGLHALAEVPGLSLEVDKADDQRAVVCWNRALHDAAMGGVLDLLLGLRAADFSALLPPIP